ncbi:MAG TPA: right-handed parallel beta-helix repeat-containing protein [Saprospiraceae bacterium]|nr:right-handed parallel beta-helix repeat-containing protein [Saprospiraceae bacterium]
MVRRIITIIFLALTINAYATTFQVGSSKPYVSPNALYTSNVVQAGDTIEIDGETYTGTATLAVWNKNNLFIIGVNGRPHLIADGTYILGKGIWVLSGNNITVENVEFSDASVPDNNGAGIRLDGMGLTVRHCYFHENETGILTNNNGGDILIEFTEFDHNSYGDGFSHNLYIGHVNSLTFRFNYSHHAVEGHNLKSRANENYIYYNRIMDEETGASSRLIDLPNGGYSIVMGNLLMEGENSPNSNLVGYGQEGLSNPGPHEFYFINNTLVNKRIASGLYVDIDGQPDVVNIINNIFAGPGTLTNGPITTFDHNLVETVIADVGFVDEANFDYHLISNSPAIDYGIEVDPVNGSSLTPEFGYLHPVDSETRSLNGTIDAGAYEYATSTAILDLQDPDVLMYPNPTQGKLDVITQRSISAVLVLDCNGRAVMTGQDTKSFEMPELPIGLYFVALRFSDGSHVVKTLIKS